MKIDFEHIDIYVDIEHTRCVQKDIKKDFANVLYTFGSGIACHALALKIYNANSDTEYDDSECKLIRTVCEEFYTPAVIDAIDTILSNTNSHAED